LSLLALGETERGAERLEDLARRSGADAARAPRLRDAGTPGCWPATPTAPSRRDHGADPGAGRPGLLLDRALASGAMERYAEAAEDLDRAVALDPYRARPGCCAARRSGSSAAGGRGARRGARPSLAPDNADALLERGALRRAKGDVAGRPRGLGARRRAAPDSERRSWPGGTSNSTRRRRSGGSADAVGQKSGSS
jgi:hypothetical protein